MIISVHPSRYNITKARENKRYGAFFTHGWKIVDTTSVETIKSILTRNVWSPIEFLHGYRKAENFLGSRLLVLDFDNPGYSLNQCLREWCDTIHFVGTTKSHQRDKGGVVCDRFRLVVPYDQRITNPDTYQFNYQKLAERYDADTQTKDRGRLFYPCDEIVSVNMDGEYQPVVKPPPSWTGSFSARLTQKLDNAEIGSFPMKLRGVLRYPVPPGKRNTTWYGFAKDLTLYGFSPERVLDLILTSETYRGVVVSKSLRDEIKMCCAHGHAASLQELTALEETSVANN